MHWRVHIWTDPQTMWIDCECRPLIDLPAGDFNVIWALGNQHPARIHSSLSNHSKVAIIVVLRSYCYMYCLHGILHVHSIWLVRHSPPCRLQWSWRSLKLSETMQYYVVTCEQQQNSRAQSGQGCTDQFTSCLKYTCVNGILFEI